MARREEVWREGRDVCMRGQHDVDDKNKFVLTLAASIYLCVTVASVPLRPARYGDRYSLQTVITLDSRSRNRAATIGYVI